jgi:hypothetical protein
MTVTNNSVTTVVTLYLLRWHYRRAAFPAYRESVAATVTVHEAVTVAIVEARLNPSAQPCPSFDSLFLSL